MYQKRNNELRTLSLYLGGYAKQFYLRELSRLVMIPLKTTQNTVATLEKNGIMKSAVRGKNKYFKLNLDNVQTKFYLLQTEVHKTMLFLQKYPFFKTFLKDLRTTSMLVVFGSYARFEAREDSDVDLLVVAEKKEKIPSHLLPYKVHEIRMAEESFARAIEKRETLMKEIEENHVILNNHSFYVNAMWERYGK